MNNPFKEPPLIHLTPIFFLAFALFVATIPLVIHVFSHPFTYIISTTPLTERIAIARHKFFFYAWRFFSPLLDPGDEPEKSPLLRKCYGTVLEIGPGVGDNIKYYRRGKVSRLVLVEPNTNMHENLRAKANASGYYEADGSLLLLGCGGAASDEKALALAGVGEGSMESISLIHVLCGIPGPAAAVEMYRRMLKPGGLLVFYEHVRSENTTTAKWQEWYTKIWPTVNDGCHLNRPTGDWIIRGMDGDMGVGRGATTGAELRAINGVEGQARRWRDWAIEVPDEQPKHAPIPHVKGWAIKA